MSSTKTTSSGNTAAQSNITAKEQRFLDRYEKMTLTKDEVDRHKRELKQATKTLAEAKADALQHERVVAQATTTVTNASNAHASAIMAHKHAVQNLDRVYCKLPQDLHTHAQQSTVRSRSASRN